MTEKRFTSVWDAIEDTAAEAENMKLRSELMLVLGDHIARTGMSQAQAAQVFGVTQPRVSDLMRGKINLFGIDALVNMAAAAGMQVEMRVRADKVRSKLARLGVRGSDASAAVRWARAESAAHAVAEPTAGYLVKKPVRAAETAPKKAPSRK